MQGHSAAGPLGPAITSSAPRLPPSEALLLLLPATAGLALEDHDTAPGAGAEQALRLCRPPGRCPADQEECRGAIPRGTTDISHLLPDTPLGAPYLPPMGEWAIVTMFVPACPSNAPLSLDA